MADLTFTQLAAQLPAGSIVALQATDPAPADGVYIRVGAVTGDAITALADSGVVESMMKLLLACSRAQAAFNTTAQVGERLRAFTDPSFNNTGFDSEGEATTRISMSLTAVLNVSIDTALSPTQ